MHEQNSIQFHFNSITPHHNISCLKALSMHFQNMSEFAAKCNGQICLFVENLEKSSLVETLLTHQIMRTVWTALLRISESTKDFRRIKQYHAFYTSSTLKVSFLLYLSIFTFCCFFLLWERQPHPTYRHLYQLLSCCLMRQLSVCITSCAILFLDLVPGFQTSPFFLLGFYSFTF